MQSRWARVARGTAAAVVATLVAALSHTLSGGSGSWFGVGVSLALAITVCTLLTGRTLSLWRLSVGIGVSQFLFHALFSDLGTPVLVEHSMSSMHVTVPHAHAAPSMWLAHAIAAVITIVAVRFGEQAFWGVGRTARLFLARLLIVVAPVLSAPRPRLAITRRFVPCDLDLLLSPMRHRGPPVALLA